VERLSWILRSIHLMCLTNGRLSALVIAALRRLHNVDPQGAGWVARRWGLSEIWGAEIVTTDAPRLTRAEMIALLGEIEWWQIDITLPLLVAS
jgi:hypothetical protein